MKTSSNYKLESNEEKYKFLIDNMQEMAIILDKTGKILFANKFTFKTLGYSEKEVIGKSITVFLTRDSLKKALYALTQEFLGKPQNAMEVEVRNKKGEIRNLLIAETSSPIYTNNKMVEILISANDITERKKAEEMLQSKTALLEALMNSVIDGILVVDAQGNKILQNKRCIELWKIPKNIVASKDDNRQVEFVKNRTKDPKKFVEKVVYLYSHPDETSHDEVEFKDGMILERYSAPVIDTEGKNYGRIWMFHDITNRVLAERKLRESETKSFAAFHTSPNLMAITKINGIILDVNEGYSQMLGYSRDESVGKTTNQLSIWASPTDRTTFVNRLKETSQVIDFETTLRCKNGTLIRVIDSARIFDFQGEKCILSVAHDITERKQIEEELIKSKDILQSKVDELQKFNQITIDRELKMIELKNKIKELEEKLNRK